MSFCTQICYSSFFGEKKYNLQEKIKDHSQKKHRMQGEVDRHFWHFGMYEWQQQQHWWNKEWYGMGRERRRKRDRGEERNCWKSLWNKNAKLIQNKYIIQLSANDYYGFLLFCVQSVQMICKCLFCLNIFGHNSLNRKAYFWNCFVSMQQKKRRLFLVMEMHSTVKIKR